MLILEEVRCLSCKRKLGNVNGQAQIKCPKCKAIICVDTDKRKIYIEPERQK